MPTVINLRQFLVLVHYRVKLAMIFRQNQCGRRKTHFLSSVLLVFVLPTRYYTIIRTHLHHIREFCYIFFFCFLCLHQARLAGRGLFFSTCPFVHLSGKHKINEPVLMPIGTNDPRLTVRVTRSKVEVTKAKYRFSGLVTSLLTPLVK